MDLRVVTTNLRGASVQGGTTFEHVMRFDGSAFDTETSLEPLVEAVAASSAFPGVFAPVRVRGEGGELECVDGGIVNETPIKLALDDAQAVDRIFVVVPYPSLYEAPSAPLSGIALGVHLVEILIQERLHRDVRAARESNDALAALEAAIHDDAERRRILTALQWKTRRRVEIVEIRPPTVLEGGAFDGVFSRSLRERYVTAGRAAALAWVAARAAPGRHAH